MEDQNKVLEAFKKGEFDAISDLHIVTVDIAENGGRICAGKRQKNWGIGR